MLAGTFAFAAQPTSRRWRRAPEQRRPRRGSLGSPAIRTLVLILFGTGAVYGATEVGVTAATKALGSVAAGGPLLGLWGLGSLVGGIAATRLGGGARRASGLTCSSPRSPWVTARRVHDRQRHRDWSGDPDRGKDDRSDRGQHLRDGRRPRRPERSRSVLVALHRLLTGAALGAAVAGGLAQTAGAEAAFAFAGSPARSPW